MSTAPARSLAAGDLACSLEADGSLRAISWRGTELIRGVAYLLRDTDWGTAPAQVRGLQVQTLPQAFSVRFELAMALPEGTWQAHARIDGHADGRLRFEVTGRCEVPLKTNRCGFVLLHPAAVAGLPLGVEHTDGAHEASSFPLHISPGQPVLDIRQLSHEPLPGLLVQCRLEGVKFEMEDQRNWSDASFKTYAGSLFDPWPYELPAGRELRQSVTLTIQDTRAPVSTRVGATPAPLTVGAVTTVKMPAIGLGVPAGAAALTEAEHAAVMDLAPAWLIAEADLQDSQGVLERQLRAVAQLAREGGAQVQLDVLCPPQATPQDAAGQLQALLYRLSWQPQALRPCPHPYLKSYQPSGPWPDVPPLDHYAAAFGAAFPGCAIGGGMLTYFTELNRKRPPADGLHFIGHTTCPLVHAADDVSVMQTLECLPHIARSVQALWPALPYRLGPATIAMHRNPYGSRPAPNPQGLRLAMAEDDPRHRERFGAAWVVGYAAAVAPFGLQVLAFNHSHGASGPLQRQAVPQPVPAWAVQRILARAAGAAVLAVANVPEGVAALAWQPPGGPRQLLLANLQAQPCAVTLANSRQELAPYQVLHLCPVH